MAIENPYPPLETRVTALERWRERTEAKTVERLATLAQQMIEVQEHRDGFETRVLAELAAIREGLDGKASVDAVERLDERVDALEGHTQQRLGREALIKGWRGWLVAAIAVLAVVVNVVALVLQ